MKNIKQEAIIEPTFNPAVLCDNTDRENKWLALKKVNLEFVYNNISDTFAIEIYSGKRKDDSTRVFKITFKRDSEKISEEIKIDFIKNSLCYIIQSFHMDEHNLVKIAKEINSEFKEFSKEVEKETEDINKAYVKHDKTSIIICYPELGFSK